MHGEEFESCVQREIEVDAQGKAERVEEMALDGVILILPSQLSTCLCLACRAACVSASPPSRYKIISL